MIPEDTSLALDGGQHSRVERPQSRFHSRGSDGVLQSTPDGIFLLFSFFAHMARGAMKAGNLSALDRVLGLVLGVVMGLTLCAIGFVVWGHVAGSDDLRETLEGSTSAHYMAHTVDILDPLFPDGVRERFHKSLTALDQAAE